MIARKSHSKGARTERNTVHLLQDAGFAAEKCSCTGYGEPDLTVPLLGVDRQIEVKCRADGFREIYRWLDSTNLLIPRADWRMPLVVLQLPLAINIAIAGRTTKTKE
jgi:hypothetical protein